MHKSRFFFLLCLFLFSGLARGEVRLAPVYRSDTVYEADPSIALANRPLWIEVEGQSNEILQLLIRDAFRRLGFEVIEKESEAAVRIKYSALVNIDIYNPPPRLHAALGLLSPEIPLAIDVLNAHAQGTLINFMFNAGENLDPGSEKEQGESPSSGKILYGHMPDAPVPGGVYVVMDAIPSKNMQKQYFTSMHTRIIFEYEGKSKEARVRLFASANHIPIVPMLERSLDELFKLYGSGAPKIRFPRVLPLPER